MCLPFSFCISQTWSFETPSDAEQCTKKRKWVALSAKERQRKSARERKRALPRTKLPTTRFGNSQLVFGCQCLRGQRATGPRASEREEGLWEGGFSEVFRGLWKVFRGPLRDTLRGRFPSRRLSVLLPLIVLPLEHSPTGNAFGVGPFYFPISVRCFGPFVCFSFLPSGWRKRGVEFKGGVAFMTVLAVLMVLAVLQSTLPSFRLSYKIHDQQPTVTVLKVLAVSAVVAVSVVTATPLKLNPAFPSSRWIQRTRTHRWLSAEKNKGGWKTQGRGKHTIKPLPKNGLDPPTYDTFPPLPICSRHVILFGGDGHRPDKSHFLRPPKSYVSSPPPKIARCFFPPFAISQLARLVICRWGDRTGNRKTTKVTRKWLKNDFSGPKGKWLKNAQNPRTEKSCFSNRALVKAIFEVIKLLWM